MFFYFSQGPSQLVEEFDGGVIWGRDCGPAVRGARWFWGCVLQHFMIRTRGPAPLGEPSCSQDCSVLPGRWPCGLTEIIKVLCNFAVALTQKRRWNSEGLAFIVFQERKLITVICVDSQMAS